MAQIGTWLEITISYKMENLLSSRIYLPFRKIALVFRRKMCYKWVEAGKKEPLSLSTISVPGEMQGEVACIEVGQTGLPGPLE